MQDVSESTAPFGSYAQPLSGLRISWGSLLAGTVVILSVSGLIWALGLAIVALATHGNWASIKGSIIALWIIAIAATLVGSFLGGVVAGALPGNSRRRIGAVHGLVAWGLAFVLSSVVGLFVLGSAVRTTTMAGVGAASAAVEATGSAAGGAAGANVPLAQRAEQTLTSLGYTPEQARTMVGRAQNRVQTANPGAAGSAVGGAAQTVLDRTIELLVAIGWSWWGTWFVALLLAVAGGAMGATGVATRASGGRLVEPGRERVRPPSAPLTPAPTT